jgi:hypothetical protein
MGPCSPSGKTLSDFGRITNLVLMTKHGHSSRCRRRLGHGAVLSLAVCACFETATMIVFERGFTPSLLSYAA